MHCPKTWLSVDEARAAILSQINTTERTTMAPIRDSLGAIAADDVPSPFNVPPHDNSAMDGFACAYRDAAEKNPLTIAGESFAGRPYPKALQPGEAVKIMTGATIPAGADVVIPIEDIDSSEHGQLRFGDRKIKPNQHIRRAGEDLQAQQIAVAAGTRIGAAEIGLLASLGIATINIYEPLRIAFFSTGDELRSIGQPLGVGEIYDSNRHTLHAMIAALGMIPIDLGRVADDEERLREALHQAASQADVVITSGGVSVGEADYIRALLAQLGDVLFWKIAMRPGRPLAYGKINIGGSAVDFFGLPGNPVSVMVCFYQFIVTALWKMTHRAPLPPMIRMPAIVTKPIRKIPGRTEYQRAVFTPQDGVNAPRVEPLDNQGSGVLSSMSNANCFIVLDPDGENVPAGATVAIQPFSSLFE